MKKILFLGDSITDGGVHVALVDTYFQTNHCFANFKVDNIGQCSENTSGLTEEGHPGARPYVFDRLERIINFYHSDIVVIMYGINDAIYKPFCEEYFERFKNGISMLVSKLKDAGMRVYLCTPTAFDPLSCGYELNDYMGESKTGTYTGYNDVMTKYAEWIRADMASVADKIIDINRAMNGYIDKIHSENQNTKTGDGIHPNRQLSAIMAQTILNEGFHCNSDIASLLENRESVNKFNVIFYRNQLIHKYEKETIGHTSPFHDRYLPKNKLDKVIQRLDNKICKITGANLSKYQFRFAKGYKYEKFLFGRIAAAVFFPKKRGAENKWLWRTEFLGAFTDADKLALERGYCLVFLNISDCYGSDFAIETMKEFHDNIVSKYSLNEKLYFLGLSRGGLSAVNFACKYPSLVGGIFLDAPVVDIFSWPKGDFSGKGSNEDWEKLLLAYQVENIDRDEYKKSLLAKLSALSDTKIRVSLITNEHDDVVPYIENGALIKTAFRSNPDYYFEKIKLLTGHHPHGGEPVQTAFDFLENKITKQ